MTYFQPVNHRHLKYSRVIGTGGIGSGLTFFLHGNDTLGRNESRMGDLMQFRDYCKLHIIIHYIAVLLGTTTADRFEIIPIGKVGNDDIGRICLNEIQALGINCRHICIEPNCSTLFSICFQYPDGTGGNITSSNSASSRVKPEDIELFFINHPKTGSGEIILAVPEVPLDARIKLLELGRSRGSLNIASILSSEARLFSSIQGYELVDLLSINIDEARKIAGIEDGSAQQEFVIDKCTKTVTAVNPSITILITDGPNGSYIFSNNNMEFIPALEVKVEATAGAGDAFLAGLISGICCELPLFKGRNDTFFSESPLCSAVELGALLAALSITTSDTIHQTANAELIHRFAKQMGVKFGYDFDILFSQCEKTGLYLGEYSN